MNESRYKEFRDYLKKLQKELGAEEFFRTLDSKLLDYAFKNPDVSVIELRAYIKEIFTPEFASYAGAIIKNYDDIVTTVNDLYSDLGVDISRDFGNIKANPKFNKLLNKYFN